MAIIKDAEITEGIEVAETGQDLQIPKDLPVLPLRWTVNLHDATAEISGGMLTVYLPKIEDRRGVEIKIPVKDGAADGENGA